LPFPLPLPFHDQEGLGDPVGDTGADRIEELVYWLVPR
jgi:hypothetical protein